MANKKKLSNKHCTWFHFNPFQYFVTSFQVSIQDSLAVESSWAQATVEHSSDLAGTFFLQNLNTK
jgi:hypothetical protein